VVGEETRTWLLSEKERERAKSWWNGRQVAPEKGVAAVEETRYYHCYSVD
jgi:hypothetical protein